MSKDDKIAELKNLQARADAIRKELNISSPSEVIYEASCDILNDDLLIVEADGFGGATVSIVEGNFPIDYCTKYAKSFATEEEAIEAAERVDEGASPVIILGSPSSQIT